jgi:hypothetical protein
MDTLADWTEALCAELGLDTEEGTQKTVLNLARVVAHTVDRPGAPLTAYLLGVAVGRGESLTATATRIQQLARDWAAAHGGPPRERGS